MGLSAHGPAGYRPLKCGADTTKKGIAGTEQDGIIQSAVSQMYSFPLREFRVFAGIYKFCRENVLSMADRCAQSTKYGHSKFLEKIFFSL